MSQIFLKFEPKFNKNVKWHIYHFQSTLSTTCRSGYKFDETSDECVDINECATSYACREHERCENRVGGYDCYPLCHTGYFFDTLTKRCKDVNECLLGRHSCHQRTQRCVNTEGSYECQVVPPCRSGFRKTLDGNCLDIDECLENTHNCRAEHYRYCINREGTYECVTRLPTCSQGYEFSIGAGRCVDIDECTTGQFTCNKRFAERCVNLPGSYR